MLLTYFTLTSPSTCTHTSGTQSVLLDDFLYLPPRALVGCTRNNERIIWITRGGAGGQRMYHTVEQEGAETRWDLQALAEPVPKTCPIDSKGPVRPVTPFVWEIFQFRATVSTVVGGKRSWNSGNGPEDGALWWLLLDWPSPGGQVGGSLKAVFSGQ